MTYTRPLLATDLSEGSAAAARLAPHVLAPDARGTGILVLSEPDLPRRVAQEVRDEILDAMHAHEKDAQRVVSDWLQSHHLRGWDALTPYGPVASTINYEAARINADVILVGGTGRGRVERSLLGSTARAILHRAQTDVLVARECPAGALRRILVATDFQPPSIHAARRAMKIAEQNENAELILIHALDPGIWPSVMEPAPPAGVLDPAWLEKHATEALAIFNKEHLGGRAKEVVARGRAAGLISAKSQELAADLVVGGTHGGTIVSRALIGSVADALAERSMCSVLIVRR